MCNRRLSATLWALVLGGTLGLLAGCDPTELDDGGGAGVPVPILSDLPCSDSEECIPNACCGQGSAITHVDEPGAPTSCPITCPPGSPLARSVDNGRCLPSCGFDNRCRAACTD